MIARPKNKNNALHSVLKVTSRRRFVINRKEEEKDLSGVSFYLYTCCYGTVFPSGFFMHPALNQQLPDRAFSLHSFIRPSHDSTLIWQNLPPSSFICLSDGVCVYLSFGIFSTVTSKTQSVEIYRIKAHFYSEERE